MKILLYDDYDSFYEHHFYEITDKETVEIENEDAFKMIYDNSPNITFFAEYAKRLGYDGVLVICDSELKYMEYFKKKKVGEL